MKNVYLLIPEDTEFEDLTPEQQEAINDIFGQYVMPQIGTRPHNDKVVCDAICDDSFNPDGMAEIGLDHWQVIGMWQKGDTDTVETIIPLDDVYIDYLMDTVVYDEDGVEISRERPELR